MKKVVLSRYVSVLIVLLSSFCAKAQDFTFSQFQTFSQVFNPACIGNGSDEGRVSTGYRNQWFASGYSYQTVLASAEYKYNLWPARLKEMAYSISFADDQVGGGQWRNSWVSLGISGSKYLDDAHRHSLSFGIGSAILSRKFNARNLIFENQFESSSFTFSPELASGENLGPVRQGFFQANAGLFYHFAFSEQISFGLGASSLWLYRPNEQLSNLTSVQGARMNRRFSINLSSEFLLAPFFSLQPQIFFSHQGKAREVNVGGWLLYSNPQALTKAWQMGLGLFTRAGDSVIPAVRLGKGPMYGQLSYDITYSQASRAGDGKTFAGIGGMGALEFSLVYGFNLKPAKQFVIPCHTF